MPREGYGSCRVSLSVKSHLASRASVRRENAAKYSASNKGQNLCGDFSETSPLPRSSAPSHDGHTSGRPFFAGNTHAHCAYVSSPRLAM